MTLTLRQYLRLLDRETQDKLFKISHLSDEQYWVLYYSFVKGRMVENTCAKLNISKSTYHNIMNVALAKVEMTLKDLNKIQTFH